MTTKEMYNMLLELGASEETINTVLFINGDNEETYTEILYAMFGYNDFSQLD